MMMRRFQEEWKASEDKEVFDAIVMFMDDDIREAIHFEGNETNEDEFLAEYLDVCPEFEEILDCEFGIKIC